MEAARVKAEQGSWSWLSWGRTGVKSGGLVEKTFGEFVQRLRLKERIICSWRLKRLRTISWERAQHLSRRGAEGTLLPHCADPHKRQQSPRPAAITAGARCWGGTVSRGESLKGKVICNC